MHPDYQIVYDTDGALERLRRHGPLTDRQCKALVYVLKHGDELYAQITRFRTAIETVLATFPRCMWCGAGTTTLRDVNGVKPMCADCARRMEFPVHETVGVDLAPLEAALGPTCGAAAPGPGAWRCKLSGMHAKHCADTLTGQVEWPAFTATVFPPPDVGSPAFNRVVDLTFAKTDMTCGELVAKVQAEGHSPIAPAPAATPVATPCEGCAGRGEVGGLLPGDGGYQTDACSFCGGTGAKPVATPDAREKCDDCDNFAGIRVCTGCWEKAKVATPDAREAQIVEYEADLQAIVDMLLPIAPRAECPDVKDAVRWTVAELAALRERLAALTKERDERAAFANAETEHANKWSIAALAAEKARADEAERLLAQFTTAAEYDRQRDAPASKEAYEVWAQIVDKPHYALPQIQWALDAARTAVKVAAGNEYVTDAHAEQADVVRAMKAPEVRQFGPPLRRTHVGHAVFTGVEGEDPEFVAVFADPEHAKAFTQLRDPADPGEPMFVDPAIEPAHVVAVFDNDMDANWHTAIDAVRSKA